MILNSVLFVFIKIGCISLLFILKFLINGFELLVDLLSCFIFSAIWNVVVITKSNLIYVFCGIIAI